MRSPIKAWNKTIAKLGLQHNARKKLTRRCQLESLEDRLVFAFLGYPFIHAPLKSAGNSVDGFSCDCSPVLITKNGDATTRQNNNPNVVAPAYESALAPHPIIRFDTSLPELPAGAYARLSVGSKGYVIGFDPTDDAGDYTFEIQIDAGDMPSGRYSWLVRWYIPDDQQSIEDFQDEQIFQEDSGVIDVVNRHYADPGVSGAHFNEYGVGWYRPHSVKKVKLADIASVIRCNCVERIYLLESDPDLTVPIERDFERDVKDGLVLDIGRLSDQGLGESWLACRSDNALVMAKWKRIAADLKSKTNAGVTAINRQNGASAFYKTLRYSDRAAELDAAGVPMIPPQGPTGPVIRLGKHIE